MENETTLNNFKAQYNSIKGNISVANSELEKALLGKAAAEESYQEIGEKVAAALGTLDEIETSIEKKEAILADVIRQIAEAETVFGANQSYHIDTLSQLEEEKKKVWAVISAQKKLAEELTDEVASLRRGKEGVSNELAALTEAVGKVQADYQRLEREGADTLLKIGEQKTKLEKEIAKAGAELKKVSDQIADEKTKTGKPAQALDEREKAIAKREANFEIMYARLNKVFKKMYPEQQLKI